ncbi:MAG: hypothetical protein ACFCBV_13380 [Phycisphaerales bacterium]
MRRIGAFALLLGVGVLASGGCEAGLPASFESADAGSRIRAVVASADDPDAADLRGMVEALGSDDPALRTLAIAALERAVRERFGYDPWAAEIDRRRAIDRWEVWLAQHAEAASGPATMPAGTP